MATAIPVATALPSATTIVDAVFPYDAPSKDEKIFLSIVCEEEQMKWTAHEGDDFRPTFSWKTPYLESTDRSVPPCVTINRFLSEQMVTFFFGTVDVTKATPTTAAEVAAATRTVAALSVYIFVPTITSADVAEMVELQEADIAFLFRDVPARLFRIQSQHFFPNDSSPQPMLSSNRAAALYAAMKEHGAPTLLIDAGVSIAHLAVDQSSSVLGGGITMGLNLRFVALHDYCGFQSFPSIPYETFRKVVDEAMQQKKPIPLFASDPVSSVMGAAVSEVAGHTRCIANQFLATVGTPAAAATTSSDNNATPQQQNQQTVTIAITGDDTQFVEDVLRADHSYICKPEPGTTIPLDNVKVVADQKLMPKGISLLMHTTSLQKKEDTSANAAEDFRDRVLGIRGARAEVFLVELDNKAAIYRGTIVRVFRGKNLEDDTYEMFFDNAGEKVLLDQVELYDALRLYEEVGELNDESNQLHFTDTKKETSLALVEQLEKNNKKVADRKQVLDCMKESEGSISSILGTPSVPKRGTKRSRPAKTFVGDAKTYIGKRIAKWFEDDELYFGTVDQVSRQDEKETWWHVVYDDGDQEEFDVKQLRRALADFEENKSSDPKKSDGV